MSVLDVFNVIVILFIHSINHKGNVTCDIMKHSEECALLIQYYAGASADFIFCTVQNARPIQICSTCIGSYNAVLDSYDKIFKSRMGLNSSCDEKLINQDRLEVIESSLIYIQNLWSRGKCKNCFRKENDSFDLSNTTLEFNKLFSDTNQCLQNFYNSTNKTYGSDVCHNCSSLYCKMNKFYFDLKEAVGNGNICMDIVDAMNITQNLWSNVLHCGGTVMTIDILLVICSSIILLLPVVFYFSAWKFSATTPAHVWNQNRLSQKFRERWRSQTTSSVSN